MICVGGVIDRGVIWSGYCMVQVFHDWGVMCKSSQMLCGKRYECGEDGFI
jgi:hypothetical protein